MTEGLKRRSFLGTLALALAGALSTRPGMTAGAPALMLAGVYRPGIALDAYWLSEKYDGLRALWTGQRLVTRSGDTIAAPAWFTARWPATPMDGELWAGRGRFEEALSTVRQQIPDDVAWRRIRFMVFDLPSHPAPFTERIAAYHGLVQQIDEPWVQPVAQERVASHAVLMTRLDRMVKDGGEGLMLHRGDAPYRAVRGDDLLKVKKHDDAEARVIAHLPGEGRHTGRMGSLLVETPEGVRFRLGTGFSDAQRERPPAPGSWVTYRYRGFTDRGVPRFASFLRVRDAIDRVPS